MYDHGVYVGDIQSRLDDGGGYQHIDLPGDKVHHDLFQLILFHLPMGIRHRCLRHQCRHRRSDIRYIVNPVVDIKDLSSPSQLPDNGLPDHLLIVLKDIGLYGQTLVRRLLQNAHIPDADQTHMKGTGDGGGSQSQHVHILFEFLDLLLVGYAKTLLLIDDKQPQILEFYILRQHSVGADHNIHQALLQIRDGLLDLPRGAEPGQQLHPHRKVFHSLGKSIVMLLGQNRGGHQIHHLLALLYGLESRPYGNLRLAVPHVSADQPVHDLAALHIRLGVGDGRQLILRLLKGEHLFKLPLPHRILAVLVPCSLLPQGIEFHQVPRHLVHGCAHLGLGAVPFFGAQLIQFRLAALRRRVLLDHVQTGGQHIEIAAVTVLDLHVVLDDFFYLHLFYAPVDAQAVGLVYHIVAHLKFLKIMDLLALIQFLFLLFLFRAKNIRLCDHHIFDQRIFKPFVHVAVIGQNLPGLHFPKGVLRIDCCQLIFPQILRQPFRPGP